MEFLRDDQGDGCYVESVKGMCRRAKLENVGIGTVELTVSVFRDLCSQVIGGKFARTALNR